MRQNLDVIIKQRAEHHEALRAMIPGTTLSGLQIWRKLRYLERKAERMALQLCNGPEMSEAMQERITNQVREGVEKLFGYVPPGFFINLDPRGYALKLQPGSVPHKLHEDWGRYQILAPLID